MKIRDVFELISGRAPRKIYLDGRLVFEPENYELLCEFYRENPDVDILDCDVTGLDACDNNVIIFAEDKCRY